MPTEHCRIICIVLLALRDNPSIFSSKGTNSNIAIGCQCDLKALFGSRSHTLEVLGLCLQLHEAFGSCGVPMRLLSQNGNGFSGVAAGLLGV